MPSSQGLLPTARRTLSERVRVLEASAAGGEPPPPSAAAPPASSPFSSASASSPGPAVSIASSSSSSSAAMIPVSASSSAAAPVLAVLEGGAELSAGGSAVAAAVPLPAFCLLVAPADCGLALLPAPAERGLLLLLVVLVEAVAAEALLPALACVLEREVLLAAAPSPAPPAEAEDAVAPAVDDRLPGHFPPLAAYSLFLLASTSLARAFFLSEALIRSRSMVSPISLLLISLSSLVSQVRLGE